MKKGLIAGISVGLVVILLAAIFIGSGSNQRKLNGLLDLGQKYLDEMEYEDAVVVFDEAIVIDPKCEQAYMGKAQAQYALGRYEDAVATLREGIEKVDDSTELEVFLQQILDEMSDIVTEENTVEIEEKSECPFLLNYTRIVRRTDTEEPDIQLEILGGNAEENYIWKSDNLECATVSEAGLVTGFPVAGNAVIEVTDETVRCERCLVEIIDSQETSEYENVRIEVDSGEPESNRYFIASLLKEEEQQETEIISESWLGVRYVYYSGDIVIPEQLTYKGQDISVTGISEYAFYWCNAMESISIPATVRNVTNYGNPFNYCFELEEIKVDDNNAFLKSVDGVLYSKDGKELISYPAAKSGGTYTIPNEVEKIYSGAFVGCRNLQEILVEEGNRYYESIDGVLMDKENRLIAYPIGNKAVSYTTPDNIVQIGENAFYMSELEEVICKGVENISTEGFRQSSKLKRIGGGHVTKSLSVRGRHLNSKEVVEISGIDEMDKLEYLGLDFFDDSTTKTMDLQEIGKLKSLKHLYICGIKDLSELKWIKNLQLLEWMEISGTELGTNDLSLFEGLSALETVTVSRIQTLSDISWVRELNKLQRINLSADKIATEDFSSLFELPNLQYVSIANHSKNEKLAEQFETIKTENPNMTVSYSEYGE